MEILFVSSFTTSSARFSEFDSRNVILFQIKVFGRYIKETTLIRYFIKVTARPSFTRLKVIRWINRVHEISKWKISYENSVISRSYSNLLALTRSVSHKEMSYIIEIINFAKESLIFQNKLLNGASFISDTKLPWVLCLNWTQDFTGKLWKIILC